MTTFFDASAKAENGTSRFFPSLFRKQQPRPELHPSPVVTPDHLMHFSGAPEHTPVRENVRQWGFEQAALSHGCNQVLKNCLSGIRQLSFFRDAGHEAIQQQHREATLKKIAELSAEKSRLEKDISDCKEKASRLLQSELQDVESRKQSAIKEAQERKRGSGYQPVLVALMTFWLLVLSVAVSLFYVSALHSAFFRNILAETQGANLGNIDMLLNSIFNPKAVFQLNAETAWPWLLGCSFFFLLGLLPELTKRNPSPGVSSSPHWMFLVLAIVVDVLLAIKIESNIHLVRELTGTESEMSTRIMNFLLVLVFGLGAYFTWARSFKYWTLERNRKEPGYLLKETLEALGREAKDAQKRFELSLDELKKTEQELGLISPKILQAQAELERKIFNRNALKIDVDTFMNGWLGYLAASGAHETQRTMAAQLAAEAVQPESSSFTNPLNN